MVERDFGLKVAESEIAAKQTLHESRNRVSYAASQTVFARSRWISWRLRRFRTPTSPISVMPTVHQKHAQPARWGSSDGYEVSLLPPGHDAWVVGDEPVVVIDISGMANYAKPA